MNPSGRTTIYGASSNTRHKKVVNQPSDPLNKTNSASGHTRIAVRDIYSPNSSQGISTKDNDDGDGDDLRSNGSTSGVRRLSQSGVTPGSQEFQSVLRDFIPPPEEKQQPKESKSHSSKTKCRKISFNEFGRASRFAKRLEDMSLSPRPKRSIDMLTTPAISSSINNARTLENNETLTQSRKGLPFYGIKEAWYEPESSQSSRSETRRRHVSLPAPPTGFALEKLTDSRNQETLVEPFRTEKPPRRKSSNNNNNNSAVRIGRKISTVVSPNFNMNTEATQPTQSQNARKWSPTNSAVKSTENEVKMKPRKDTPPHFDMKKKKLSGVNGQDLHPNLLLGIKPTSHNEGDFPPSLEKQFSTEDAAGEQHVAMKAHKNFKRIGKAALAARRFMKINNDDSGMAQKRGISPLAKEEKQFDEMVEVMKTSYQDLSLDDRGKRDLNDE